MSHSNVNNKIQKKLSQLIDESKTLKRIVNKETYEIIFLKKTKGLNVKPIDEKHGNQQNNLNMINNNQINKINNNNLKDDESDESQLSGEIVTKQSFSNNNKFNNQTVINIDGSSNS